MSVAIKEEQKKTGHVSLSFEGEITIYTVAEIKSSLMEHLFKADKLELDLSKVQKMDTAGYQLFIFLKRESEIREKSVDFLNPSDEVARLLELYKGEF